ncbi:hypothetical protein IQ238_05730 [Pleurocapsales cyanobacterium LEGE 06147]|nr:hypothetical protein [Pleurocapsales cyanobacterium LEGE 06147]
MYQGEWCATLNLVAGLQIVNEPYKNGDRIAFKGLGLNTFLRSRFFRGIAFSEALAVDLMHQSLVKQEDS